MKILKKNYWRFSLVELQIGILIFSFVPLISKHASNFKYSDIRFLISYLLIISFLFFYFFIWQKTLKKLPLTIAYSYRSTQLIWSLLWSYLFYGQKITFNNILGSVIILIGIYKIYNE